MIVLAIMVVAAVALALGARFYAPLIGRVLGERQDRVTPAVAINDGRDYVPTRTPVVFAHHYASIAGAGPIVGPVVALLYGWGPALAWILIGGIFLGAVHDYAATHITMREGGKNLTVVARRYISPGAFVMLLLLLIALLALVCAAFLDLSATALTSKVPVSTLQLSKDQTLFRMTEAAVFDLPAEVAGQLRAGEATPAIRDAFAARGAALSDAVAVTAEPTGRAWRLTDTPADYVVRDQQGTFRVYTDHAIIGGIASTSVVVITACSPLIGLLYLKRQWPVWLCSLLAMGICALSITVGLKLPMSVEPLTWKLMISGYVLISAGLPVWLFLQSRDFINVHLLYVGMALLVVALVAAGFSGGGHIAEAAGIPLDNWAEGTAAKGPGWPVLFVLIACGAVSGFHSLCAGGTTCKQLSNELAARRVGYYAMLLESFLAVCVVCSLAVGLSLAAYKGYCHPPGAKGNAVLTFAMAVGHTTNTGLGISIAAGALGAMLLLEGFLVTTLDTAIRLTRYMIEEGWANFFGRYDVFADAARAQAAAAAVSAGEKGRVTGTGGLTIDQPPVLEAVPTGPPVETRGPGHFLLRTLRYYWINSGIAVVLMLLLGLGNGYQKLWSIFGTANQLLAALALLVASTWLYMRRRPIWYTLLPALFMLLTSVRMLVRLIAHDMPGWPNNAALVITEYVVLAMTLGIVALAVVRWHRGRPAAPVTAGA